MAVHRERVDRQEETEEQGLVHRRWILPDDASRPVTLSQLARLWRGLLELSVLDENDDVIFEKLPLPLPEEGEAETEARDIPAGASPGLLLAAAKSATMVTQVVRIEDGHRDPYHEPEAEGDWRDYALYLVDGEDAWLVPIGINAVECGKCKNGATLELPWFGEAQLLEVGRFECPQCGADLDISRDKAELLTGDVFLLEEVCCKAALAIELPDEPGAEELPDVAVAGLLTDAFGGTDELSHHGVEPS